MKSTLRYGLPAGGTGGSGAGGEGGVGGGGAGGGPGAIKPDTEAHAEGFASGLFRTLKKHVPLVSVLREDHRVGRFEAAFLLPVAIGLLIHVLAAAIS